VNVDVDVVVVVVVVVDVVGDGDGDDSRPHAQNRVPDGLSALGTPREWHPSRYLIWSVSP
jgi:hypothetical protein